jgi:hypothetical protein
VGPPTPNHRVGAPIHWLAWRERLASGTLRVRA